MAKLAIKPDTANVTLLVFVQDSASTTGGGKTGIAYNAAGISAYYARPGATASSIGLATQTVTGAHSDGGWVEVDATNLPGVYRFDLPDAVCAAGVRSAVVMVKGASGMAPLVLEIDLGAEVTTTTNSDKTGYSLSAGGVAAIYAALTEGATDVSYNLDGTINVITLDSGCTITHTYTDGQLTSWAVAAPPP